MSPCRTAVASIEAASEPAAGSESENAASSRETRRGRKRRRCASLPNRNTGSAPTELCTAIMIASAAETRAISSSTTTIVRESYPTPPHSSGIAMPRKPCSASFDTASRGTIPSWSQPGAKGANSRSHSSRTASRTVR